MPKFMNLKKLYEDRTAAQLEMQGLLDTADKEERALTDTESEKFDQLEATISGIDKTINAEKRAQELSLNAITEEKREELTTEMLEERAFESYIRGTVAGNTETRADLTVGANGAVIPKTIANKIIEKVENICSIYSHSTHYNVSGTLSFPVYDESEGKVEMAYANEFEDIASTGGKFTSVEMTGFLAGALTKVSKSLINNSQFDIVSYVITKMAKAVSRFMEHEFLIGTAGKCTGVLSSTVSVTAAATSVITADELIDVQMTVPEVYQTGARWIMNTNTFKAIRKLKDGNNNYLLNRDVTTAFGWTLLGKPVEISDIMPDIAAGTTPIAYGDFSGLYTKVNESAQVQVLVEKYATQHVVGVVCWMELDSKIIEPQKLVVFKMKAA